MEIMNKYIKTLKKFKEIKNKYHKKKKFKISNNILKILNRT